MKEPIDEREAKDFLRGYARRFVIAQVAERHAMKQLDTAVTELSEARDLVEEFLTPTQIRLIIEDVENMGPKDV